MRPMGTGVGERTPKITDAAVGRASDRRASQRHDPHHRAWLGSWTLWLALGLVLAFLANTALVVTGVSQSLDARAIHALRPGDGWGPAQIRWAPWMSRLRPQHMYLTLAATSLVMSAWRRSLWPLAFGLAVGGGSAALTVLLKLGFHRPDPHGYLASTGGSYPSGHMIAVLTCLGGCLLVVSPRVRLWWWASLVGAAGLMSLSLLVSAAHWPTDIAGGALLAGALLSTLGRSPLRYKACEPRGSHRDGVHAVG